MNFSGSVFLITGGTGSLAKALVPKLLGLDVHSVRLFSRNEHSQEAMRHGFDDDRLRFFIGDVRDKERLALAMGGVDYVVHAAALKTIAACEYNPWEAYATNVGGAWNVVTAALAMGVKTVVGISTDKACAPVTTYGATKCLMEHIFRGANNAGICRTIFCCTRNGNVVGSKGSILPLLLLQKKSGQITITDDRMSRFWLPMSGAVDCIMFALEHTRGGEVFIKKAPSLRIQDLADTIAPGCSVLRIGTRAQEKIAEVLVEAEEARRTRDAGDYYIVEPEAPTWKRDKMDQWPLVEDGFIYSSNRDPWRVSKEEMLADAKSFCNSGSR